jgi:hypothetical protein
VVCVDKLQGCKHYFQGAQHDGGAIDLIIVDLLEGLHVPSLSAPSHEILHWNMANKFFLDCLFSFYTSFLHDDDALLVFY